jgi:hypothetical protein
MPGGRTGGRSWKLAVDAQNPAFFRIPDQSAFGGRLSLNLLGSRGEAMGRTSANSTFENIIPAPPARMEIFRASWTFPLDSNRP